jgi:hypothetical protein
MVDLSDPTFWIPTVISIIAVIITLIEVRHAMKQEKLSKTMLDLVNDMRKELRIFRVQANKSSLSSEELKKQQLLLREQEQKWKQVNDLAKGFKWFVEMSQTSNEEDED